MTVRELRDALTRAIEEHPEWATSEIMAGGDVLGDVHALVLYRYDWIAVLGGKATDAQRKYAEAIYTKEPH